MIKKSLVFLIIFISSYGIFALNSSSDRQTMNFSEAKTRWGNSMFDSLAFKNGSRAIRAKMASSILQKNPFLNKSATEVISELGPHDGYYFNDVVPAYLLNDDLDDIWQLVFMVDSNRIVCGVQISKNCCEKK